MNSNNSNNLCISTHYCHFSFCCLAHYRDRKASEGDSQIFGLRNLLEDSVVSFTEVRMIRFGKNSQVLFLTC